MTGLNRGTVPLLAGFVVLLGTATGAPCAGQDAGGARAPVRVEPLRGKARLEGRVVDEAGARVASARVRVYGWADVLVACGSFEFGWASPPPPPRATTLTDPAGWFTVADIVRGMNVVVVETAAGERGSVLATAIEERPVVVHLKTSRGAGTLLGQVVDEDGAPLPDVPVVAAPANVLPVGDASILALFTWTARTVTDATGTFRVHAPTEDVLVAAMRPRDGCWTTRRWRPEDAAASPPLRLAFAGGGPLSGRVEGATSGRPVAGARVTIVARTDPGTEAWTLLPVDTDERGTFSTRSFPRLGGGGLAVLAPRIGGDWHDGSEPFAGRLKVRRGATLTGHVRTGDGAPVEGARVIAHVFSWPAQRTTTDGSGAYAIEGLPRVRPWLGDPAHQANGLVQVWVDAPGYASATGVRRLNVAPTATDVTADFVLHEGATVRGQCDPADADRGVTWAPGDFEPYGTMLFVRGTGVAEDGSFVLTDLPAGRVSIGVSEDGAVVVDGLRPGESRTGVVIAPAR